MAGGIEMNEQESQQIGDRVDHYGEAARQIASAVQQMGRGTSAQHVATGANVVSNAAAAAVRTGAESGRIVAAAASGTAVGGPWGAALAATWSLRHTVSKVLIASCLALLIMVVLIVSLPAVVTNDVFGLDGSAVDMEHPITILESYNDLASAVSACVDEGYRLSLDKVEEIIRDGDYDYELSMEALINYAQSSAGYDVSYIPLRELSYQRMMDAATAFQPGQRILVKIVKIDRSDRNNIQVSASVKQAGDNPYEKALRRYTVGNRYVGTVSMVDTTGVFVALDGGIDCLCSYPKRGRPPRGSRVTVRILGINHDTNRIWGAITHIAVPH